MSRYLNCRLVFLISSRRVNAHLKTSYKVPILFEESFFVKHRILQVQHSSYPPELAPCNFSSVRWGCKIKGLNLW